LSSIQQQGADVRQRLASLATPLRQHRALTRVSLATLALGVALAASLQGAAAGPEPTPVVTRSILPQHIATGVTTDAAVTIDFEQPMDPQSVEEALSLRPGSGWRASWSDDGMRLQLSPERRWRTDARYMVSIGSRARAATGASLGVGRSFSFTTETAPVISDFQLHYVAETTADRVRADAEAEAQHAASGATQEMAAPLDTSSDVSAATSISIGFSSLMDRDDVERSFAISPAVEGELSWSGDALVFTPTQRLEPGARYSVSLVGAHDARGNRLAGDISFSFTTRAGAQVVKLSPANGAKNVDLGEAHLWFSQPMDLESTRAALRIESADGNVVTGRSAWNEAGTQLRFTFENPLPAGEAFRITLADGARDRDGNAVTGTWSFTTKAPPAAVPQAAAPRSSTPTNPGPTRPSGPPAPSDILQLALWQVNKARAQYGFASLRLDGAITQVATAYAWDLINYNRFSHTGRDGSRVADRLRRAGIGFSHSGENLCYHAGIGVRATLDWCHRTFMSEPYPGYFNHIANILNPRFTRVGIGIAQSGGQVKIVWNFAG
jgi:uncharacterized protein YkwD